VGADSNTREGTIGEDENGSEGTDVLLDLSHNTLLVELVLLNTASVDQSRGVEDANLGWALLVLTTFKNAGTYYHTVVAPEFVEASRGGWVQNIEVAVINVLTGKDISE